VNINNMYTPATTMVEECSKAETGVGPSIASGSQPLKTCKEDLAITESSTKLNTPPISAINKAISLKRLCLSAEEEEVFAIFRELKVDMR